MDYKNYEDYMREVLGYQSIPNSNLYNTYNSEYEMPANSVNIEELDSMYPDIYKILHPMVVKILEQNSHRKITREVLDEMTSEIYNRMEPEEPKPIEEAKPLRNGDVINPNAKESIVIGETRQRNFLLDDLIRILLLRQLIRPDIPPHGFGGRPPFSHVPPHKPGRRPPIPPIRPRGYNGLY